MDNKFKIGYVIDLLKNIQTSLAEHSEVPF